ncbi:sugar ABC transporter ATP-binding protein [Brochothrix campestris]|uniref:Ribose transport system ATP-binding protein n=1 Tax=Brochothrix campestris FSL F6-1037 TaxID=1265861 RepID=W7CY39_9LIST|nr:sugar ABC transporter ATP-binding protein [Brochothrix campestris]EUJ41675.1 ribose transport system ATP-binding protein [Brochothrix campestris FSL F6-1037]
MKITMTNIHKAFGKNEVLKGVDFELLDGEIHALMGENGAGKSTLMNILTGLHQLDQGDIKVDGKPKNYKNPQEAETDGIAFIHQELNIFPNLTLLENLFIGKQLSKFGVLQTKKMQQLAEAKCAEIGIKLPLYKEAGDCSVGQQQMAEIMKSLMTEAKVIIMDEPTAALTEAETEHLFRVMQQLRARGVSIVYISHRMEEIFQLCDRITIMRDGISVSTEAIAATSFDTVVKQMVGRELTERFPQRTLHRGERILEVKNLTKKGVFNNISLTVDSGEIVGVAGLMGAGRTEIMRALFAMDRYDSGEVIIKGERKKLRGPKEAIKAGMGFITENRKDEGLILDFSINDNIALASIADFSPHGVMLEKDERTFTGMLAKRLAIKMASLDLAVGSLSGGNQQKVVIAKWIGIGPQLLIMDEPTRGVDIGAKREIYQLMNELTDRGVGIIMVSSELPEVLGMSDRIVVIHEGRLTGELSRAEATQEKIMTLATGGN